MQFALYLTIEISITMIINNLLWMKVKLKFFERFTSPLLFTQILLKEGFEIGCHTIFYGPKTQNIDRERPWMLRIGDYCKITAGCTILTHDYSRSVLRLKYGQIIGEAGRTEIGNNVFIGVNSIILMGSKIGDNVIVGAGSVVSGIFPSNVVIAGNPAKIIRTLDEHLSIRLSKYQREAFLYYNCFVKRYNREPNIQEMGPFFPLFIERNMETIIRTRVNISPNGDNCDDLLSCLLKSTPLYKCFDDFKREAKKYE